jgi:hypothetical protein
MGEIYEMKIEILGLTPPFPPVGPPTYDIPLWTGRLCGIGIRAIHEPYLEYRQYSEKGLQPQGAGRSARCSSGEVSRLAG